MTVLTGTFRDIAGQLSQGVVTLVSQVTRPAHTGVGAIITEERHVVGLVAGAFVSPELDPGPIRVELSANGAFESWDILLPEDGRHDLATLIETHVDYNPSVVGRVEAAAADANRAAQAAGQSATRAADAEQRVNLVVASAADVVRGELQVQIDGATQARVDAQAAQAAAEAAALTVVDDARTQVAALVDELEVSFSDAQELVATASGHAESAAGSAVSAGESAAAADAAAAVVGGAVEGAEQSAQAAATSATTAAGHAATAQQAVGEVQQAGQAALTGLQGHVTAAEAHATAAGTARTGAETARDEAVQAAESATTGAPVGGWQRATLHQDVQDSLNRADTAMQSMPRATGSAPGGVTLAGDLGGTADAPTVPGLAGKLSVSEVSEAATGQSVPRRTQAGTIRVTAPTSDDDAATKQYVDHQVATAVPPTAGPSDEEMVSLWDAVQSHDMITINLTSTVNDQLREAAQQRGVDPETVEYLPFGVELTSSGAVDGLFQGWAKLVRAPKIKGSSGANRASSMFSGCRALTTIPDLDTSSVIRMDSMFSGCWALKSVPDLDTSSVTRMESMFNFCRALTTIPDLDTSSVTRMDSMFYGCSSLESVPALDASQVTDMGSMFNSCSSLESVTLPGLGNAFTKYQAFDLRDTKINADAANALMQSLGTPPSGGQILFPSTATGADKSIATEKGWHVTGI